MLAEIMEGNASEVQTAGGADRAAHEGGDRRRAGRARHDDAPPRQAGAHQPRGPDRHRRHGRRAPDVQRLHDGGADRRRRRLRGRQARQPLGHRPVGLRRPARGARRPDRPRARRGRPLHRARPASASCSRPPTTAPRASSSRCARSSPCARSSTSSARSPTPPAPTRQVIGVSDAAFLDTIAGALARLGAVKALVVSSADGLDEMSTSGTTRVVEVDGPECSLLRGVPRGRRAGARPPGGRSPAARPIATPRPRGGSSTASPARSATSRCSTRAPRSTSPAASTRSRRASRAAEAAIDDGARRARRSSGCGHDPASWRRRVSVLDRIVEDTRDEVARRRERVPLAAAGGGDRRAPRGAAVLGGAAAPRHLADRRAQAALAVGGRDPRGRHGRRDRPAPTSAAARPRCRSSPSRSTSAARSTTCARRAR